MRYTVLNLGINDQTVSSFWARECGQDFADRLLRAAFSRVSRTIVLGVDARTVQGRSTSPLRGRGSMLTAPVIDDVYGTPWPR